MMIDRCQVPSIQIKKDIFDTEKEISKFENEIKDRKEFIKDLNSVLNYRKKHNIDV